MKKQIYRVILILAVILGMTIAASGVALADETENGFSFTVSDGQATITGYTGLDGDVTIPDTLGGYSVTAIGDNAFRDGNKITGITISNNVVSIGNYAFCGCSGLLSVTIGNNVASIGWYTFSCCTGLSSITIPGSVTSIGVVPFRGCTKLTQINVDSQNTNYSSLNGVLFDKNRTTLFSTPEAK